MDAQETEEAPGTPSTPSHGELPTVGATSFAILASVLAFIGYYYVQKVRRSRKLEPAIS
jgi:hypothetical protein